MKVKRFKSSRDLIEKKDRARVRLSKIHLGYLTGNEQTRVARENLTKTTELTMMACYPKIVA